MPRPPKATPSTSSTRHGPHDPAVDGSASSDQRPRLTRDAVSSRRPGGGIRCPDSRVADGIEVASTKITAPTVLRGFRRRGPFVTTCYDGFLRLYERHFRRIATMKAPGGERPFLARFSPTGFDRRGFDDSPDRPLSGRDLSFLAAPDNAGVTQRQFMYVAWSADGRSLFAGGGLNLVDGGGNARPRGSRSAGELQRSVVGATDTLMGFAPFPTIPSLSFRGSEPRMDFLIRPGPPFQGPDIANYRITGRIHHSRRRTVQFGYATGAQSRMVHVPGRLWSETRRAPVFLAAPRTAAPGLTITIGRTEAIPC
jgi:hypothetical protein